MHLTILGLVLANVAPNVVGKWEPGIPTGWEDVPSDVRLRLSLLPSSIYFIFLLHLIYKTIIAYNLAPVRENNSSSPLELHYARSETGNAKFIFYAKRTSLTDTLLNQDDGIRENNDQRWVDYLHM